MAKARAEDGNDGKGSKIKLSNIDGKKHALIEDEKRKMVHTDTKGEMAFELLCLEKYGPP